MGALGSMAGTGGAVAVQVSTDLWMTWVEIAIEEAHRTQQARDSVNAAAPSDLAVALLGELKRAVVAVTAAAFAIDAWYIAVSPFISLPPDLVSAWSRSKPRHAGRMLETLKHGFALGPAGARWGKAMRQAFKLRDAAVHHTSRLQTPGPHPSGRSHVASENRTYTAEQATASADFAIEVVSTCIASPRASNLPLSQWCAARTHLPEHFRGLRAGF